MTKELFYDLHFTDTEVIAISPSGQAFLNTVDLTSRQMQNLYLAAIDAGLHVRFENVAVRDSVTSREPICGTAQLWNKMTKQE